MYVPAHSKEKELLMGECFSYQRSENATWIMQESQADLHSTTLLELHWEHENNSSSDCFLAPVTILGPGTKLAC
jgi:hypothetical protein